MMMKVLNKCYEIKTTSAFRSDLKKVKKQHKNLNKLIEIVDQLARGEELEVKYKNHKLINHKKYRECMECHIEPDWLLIYQIQDKKLILLLLATGSHSDLLNK